MKCDFFLDGLLETRAATVTVYSPKGICGSKNRPASLVTALYFCWVADCVARTAAKKKKKKNKKKKKKKKKKKTKKKKKKKKTKPKKTRQSTPGRVLSPGGISAVVHLSERREVRYRVEGADEEDRK